MEVLKYIENAIMNPQAPIIQLQQLATYGQSCFLYPSISLLAYFI